MPLIRRFGRPGLLGLAARTAVVAGTATAVSGGIMRHSARRAQEDAEQAEIETALQQQSVTAPSPGRDIVGELQKLSTLHAQGAIDDAEYSAAKAKLLT
ncbi:SHOCT domain-containing protein [Microbacterium sp. NPDC089189]|uniref:SHOCT domain-containing protein n=1 Tax=Microbacterium sp. NPDC089189 TaxID=3154972 RepID=UPI003412E982